ncbi:DUF6366 family protein [Paenibacillus sp. cl141a]|nr:DUF6366 family protein [Paenibacillus sp. cl141a]
MFLLSSLVDLVSSLGWKGTLLLFIVIIVGLIQNDIRIS